MKVILKFLVVILTLSLSNIYAQGDGPYSHFQKPRHLWGINVKYLHLNQNISVNGDLFTPNLDIIANSYPITAFYTFAIKGQHVEILAMMNPTSISSTLKLPRLEERYNDKSGFSDGFIGLKVGLINGRSLSLEEYAKKKPEFFLSGYFRYWYSGSYNKNELVNIGTNRATFELGTPMVVPLDKKNDRTNLEIFPSVRFFTKNDESIAFAEKTQAPLFVIESHLIHKFNKKLRATFNSRYQLGGETTTNNTKDGNSFNSFGGSLGIGYQFHPLIDLHIDYGGLLLEDNGIRSEMFRVTLNLTYINVKKNSKNI